MSKTLTLHLDELICHEATGENGHDEIYFKIWVDGNYWGTYPENADDSNTFDMDDEDDSHKMVSLDLQLVYGDYVDLEMREQDKENNPDKDEVIAKVRIDTNAVSYSDISTHTSQFKGAGAWYDLNWRILSQKIPSVRILGIYCQQSSTNCNQEIVEDITGVASAACDAASEVIGESKTPKAEVISAGFEAAAAIITEVGKLYEWIANALEGDDDVYLQETWKGQQSTDGAGFCPGNGTTMGMKEGDQVKFLPAYGNYFRFPLDQGSVTIEVRERDPAKHDISLGALTVDMNTYNSYKDKGAQVAVLTQYLDWQGGQGALYHLCYSLAYEDWSKAANQDKEE